MPDLIQQLRTLARGRVCFVGLGNPDWGDDALGVRLAEALLASGVAPCGAQPAPAACALVAGTTPERHLDVLTRSGFDHVVFLDAVECGSRPGSVILLGAADLCSRFPQVSTHKLSLGMLARWIESDGRTRAWLLGVQPASLRPGHAWTGDVASAGQSLAHLLAGVLTRREVAA
jgi:hydrogenase maturation protease